VAQALGPLADSRACPHSVTATSSSDSVRPLYKETHHHLTEHHCPLGCCDKPPRGSLLHRSPTCSFSSPCSPFWVLSPASHLRPPSPTSSRPTRRNASTHMSSRGAQRWHSTSLCRVVDPLTVRCPEYQQHTQRRS
jgi:hypothetical protein